MGFRNLRAPYFGSLQTADGGAPGTQVATWLNSAGETEPLGVALYGGTSRVTASGTNVAILGAPPTGFGYRLHRVVWTFSAANNNAFLNGTSSAFSYALWVAPAANSSAQGENLMGQIAGEGLTLVATAVVTVFLTYDLVRAPTIH